MADMEKELNLEAKKDLESIFQDMIVVKVNEPLKMQIDEIIEKLKRNDKNTEENLKKIKNEIGNFKDELTDTLEEKFDDNKKIVQQKTSNIEEIEFMREDNEYKFKTPILPARDSLTSFITLNC